MKHCLQRLIYPLNQNKNQGVNGDIKSKSKSMLITLVVQTLFTVGIFLVLTFSILLISLEPTYTFSK